jgi:hypothetical protein
MPQLRGNEPILGLNGVKCGRYQSHHQQHEKLLGMLRWWW